jgi:hypothetical protein
MNRLEFSETSRGALVNGGGLYAPLHFENVQFPLQERGADGADATCELVWAGRRVRCSLEFEARATPRRIADALVRMERGVAREAEPVMVVPYLSSGIAEQLQEARVSGIDLSGNYLILTDELVAVRLDQPNAYPRSRDIKKIFSYDSSIVGRFLLVEDRVFEQVNEIYEGILERGGGISLSTVSKVLKGLDEEMIISKRRGEIRLLQPEKLLERLRDGYRDPRVVGRLELGLPEGEEDSTLAEILGDSDWMWSGESSAESYVSTTRPRPRTVYTRRALSAMDSLREFEDHRFYNCIVEQTRDDFVYFDQRGQWAAPVQAYLALCQMDKREREVARSIRDHVILARWDDHA